MPPAPADWTYVSCSWLPRGAESTGEGCSAEAQTKKCGSGSGATRSVMSVTLAFSVREMHQRCAAAGQGPKHHSSFKESKSAGFCFYVSRLGQLHVSAVFCTLCKLPWLHKNFIMDTAWPLCKDCHTSNMSCKLQVTCVTSGLPLSPVAHLLVPQKISFCVASGLLRLRCAREALLWPIPAELVGLDLRLLMPQLQRQWQYARNQHVKNTQMQPSNQLFVWWTCDQCPCGQLHEWLARIYDRQFMDFQYTFCANRSLCQHNWPLTLAPSVTSFWDTAKNLTAGQVVSGSNTRRHWLCSACGHIWQAPVQSKVHNNSGCARCFGKTIHYIRQPTLTANNHLSMAELRRKQEVGLDPDKITLGSAEKVRWICGNCPRCQPHLYIASPNTL